MTAEEQNYITDELRNAVGVESDPVVYQVEKGHVARFAEAIEDPNPVYSEEVEARRSRYGGIIAPPTFFRAFRPGPPKVPIESPFKRNLDGGSDWEYHEPIRPGDTITVTQKLANVTQRQSRLGPMIIMTRETTYVNQFGQLVAVQRSTGLSY